MKLLLIILLSITSCTNPTPHFDKAIIGDSRVAYGYWDHLGICNHGVGADSTAMVLARLNTVMDHPKTVYIQVGRNDLAHYGRTIEDTIKDYRIILETLISKGITPVSTSAIPDYGENLENNILIAEFNVLLVELCKELGVEYIDINAELAPNGFLLYHIEDGIHLDGQGYQIWYDILRN